MVRQVPMGQFAGQRQNGNLNSLHSAISSNEKIKRRNDEGEETVIGFERPRQKRIAFMGQQTCRPLINLAIVWPHDLIVVFILFYLFFFCHSPLFLFNSKSFILYLFTQLIIGT